jgi:hypothetical protein
MVKKTKAEIEEDLEDLSDDELETLLALIRLDLYIGNLNLPLDCGSCTGEKGCC